MSISEQPGSTVTVDSQSAHIPRSRRSRVVSRPDPGEPGDTRRGSWWTRISPLWFCLFFALVIRVWLSLRTHGTMDGDEALLGIQAEHILQGERPIYFYGIPYFGSLEAYVAAGIFALFGPSVMALRIEAAAFGLMLVGATWWLATLLSRNARLPLAAGKWFTTVAALVAALPPLYDGIIEMRTGGGWIESFVAMLLILIAVYRLTERWRAGARAGELAWRWAVVGFVIGFGMWIYPLVSVAIASAALWLGLDRAFEIRKYMRAGEKLAAASWRALRGGLLVVAALPACALGFLPGIIWGWQNNWANIHYIFGLGGGWNLQRVETIVKVSTRYVGCVGPRVIGGGTPLEGPLLSIIHAPLLLIGVVCLLASPGMVLASFKWQNQTMLRARALAAFPALFGVCSAVLYCVSSASASILISCNADFGGHYAAPLVLALPFLCATVFTLAVFFFQERGQRRTHLADQPAQSGAVPARRGASALLVVSLLFCAYLAGQASTYGLTNPDLAFQSAYCTIAPADYQPIIHYMEQEHIRYVWATNLVSDQISFLTNSEIIVANPLAITHPDIAINRLPAYTAAVMNADRPSFMVLVRHDDAHPYFLRLLDEEQVTYKTARFPSQPGVDILVVTPLNRTVSPFASSKFDIFYCEIR